MTRRRLSTPLAVVLFAFTAALTTTGEGGVTWNGVTLGEPASALRATIGDPLRIVQFTGPTERIARYWLAGSDHTFFLIIERRGYIVAFEAITESLTSTAISNVPPDPSGIGLGDTMQQVQAKHPDFRSETGQGDTFELFGKVGAGVAAVYEFQNGRVRVFHWATGVPDLQTLPPLAEPDGSSPASAIDDAQKNEMDGVHWEYMYLADHPCDGTTAWQLEQQSLSTVSGRPYDDFHVVCPTTHARRDFYFDISSYFGKGF